MKITILCGANGDKAAEKVMSGMYEVQGSELRCYPLDKFDEMFLLGGDALLMAAEADEAFDWIEKYGKKMSFSNLLGAVLTFDQKGEQISAALNELGLITAPSLIKSYDEETAVDFGRLIAQKAAQLIGQWSLEYDWGRENMK